VKNNTIVEEEDKEIIETEEKKSNVEEIEKNLLGSTNTQEIIEIEKAIDEAQEDGAAENAVGEGMMMETDKANVEDPPVAINETEENSENTKTQTDNQEINPKKIIASLLRGKDLNVAPKKAAIGEKEEEEGDEEVPFKFQDMATYKVYKQKRADLRDIVEEKYLSVRDAKSLAQKG